MNSKKTLTDPFDVIIKGKIFLKCFEIRGRYMMCTYEKKLRDNLFYIPNVVFMLKIEDYAQRKYEYSNLTD